MDKVVHFEIPFDDKDRAMKFYKENFGWELNDLGAKMGNYVLAHTAKTDKDNMVEDKGAINGGMFQRSATAHAPAIVISVDSIDETIKKVESAGGSVVSPKMPIPNGSFARVKDSEGNVIGIIDKSK
ncbi:MAG: VOC family protein [Candidatus Doudnabacteria bacterium]